MMNANEHKGKQGTLALGHPIIPLSWPHSFAFFFVRHWEEKGFQR